jgi:hypothetical protein
MPIVTLDWPFNIDRRRPGLGLRSSRLRHRKLRARRLLPSLPWENGMRLPGFTAEASLSKRTRSRSPHKFTGPNLGAPRFAVVPQYFGGHHCYWRCYPGSGCEYVCQYFPY